jgi:CRP-like cAMP-binding protein
MFNFTFFQARLLRVNLMNLVKSQPCINLFEIMRFHFCSRFPGSNEVWEKYSKLQRRLEVPAKTILLEEGDISQSYIFIEKGSLRIFIDNKGNAKTIQFFFENEGVSSIESFINNTPSQFTIETIEPSILYVLDKIHVLNLLDELGKEPGFRQLMIQTTVARQTHYINEFVSIIRDTAGERYQKLITDRPHIIRRVPQHYIASYLGVSTVHLSRIKSKLAKGKLHF